MLQHCDNVSINVSTVNTINDIDEKEKNAEFLLFVSPEQANFIDMTFIKIYSQLKTGDLAVPRLPNWRFW